MKFFKFLRVLLIIAMAIDVLAIIPLATIFIYLPDSEIVEMIMELVTRKHILLEAVVTLVQRLSLSI